MVVLGLLLAAIAAVVGVDIVLENTSRVSGTIFQQTVTGLSLGGVFLAGAIAALVFALGLWLLFGGAARARRRRQERRAALREAAQQKDSLAAENERLARALEEERQAQARQPIRPDPPVRSEPIRTEPFGTGPGGASTDGSGAPVRPPAESYPTERPVIGRSERVE